MGLMGPRKIRKRNSLFLSVPFLARYQVMSVGLVLVQCNRGDWMSGSGSKAIKAAHRTRIEQCQRAALRPSICRQRCLSESCSGLGVSCRNAMVGSKNLVGRSRLRLPDATWALSILGTSTDKSTVDAKPTRSFLSESNPASEALFLLFLFTLTCTQQLHS